LSGLLPAWEAMSPAEKGRVVMNDSYNSRPATLRIPDPI
jgi:hypothetical protein